MATEAQRKILEKRAELREALCGVYPYFIHEGKVRAPAAAMELIQRLSKKS